MFSSVDRKQKKLKNDKIKAQNDIKIYTKNIIEIREEISRLKCVKKRIDDERDAADYIKRDFKSMINEFDNEKAWVGKEKNKVQEFLEDTLYEDYKVFYESTDEIYDELADKITSLENEIYRNEGMIGKCKASINSIVNELDKLVNW